MANIILHQVGAVTVGLDKKDGYVNATALCSAFNTQKGTNKQPSDWVRSKRAKEYIDYVAGIRGIPREKLVVSRAGNSEESGTWLHPDLADPFSSWLSVEYEFFVSQWLQDWRSGKASDRFPDSTIGQVQTDPILEGVTHISAAIDCIFATIGMKPQLLAGIKTEAIAANYPQYRPALEAAKSGLSLVLPSKPMTPTRLAEMLKERTGEELNARSMNKRLESLGLQRKTGHASPTWEAIGEGLEHSEIHADTAKGHGKTVVSLRWFESVIDALVAVAA
jgi:KilA-N domain